MKLKSVTLVIALAALAMCAEAQESKTLRLSLEEAQHYALEHNAAMQNANLETRKAELNRWKTLSTMLPQVKAGFDYQNMCGYTMNFGSRGGSMLPDSMIINTPMGPMPISFSLPTTTEDGESGGIAMNPSGTFSITASVAITGAQIVGTMLQNIAMQMTDITRRQTEQQTRSNVKNVYVSILVME